MDFIDFGDDNFTAPAVKEEGDPAVVFLPCEQSAIDELESKILPATGLSASSSATLIGGHDGLLDGVGDGVGDLAAPLASRLVFSTCHFEIIGGESNELEGITGPPPSCVKPEKLRKWREEQKKRLEEKDREEERKLKELRLQAKQELDNWLKQTEESIAKTKSATRQTEKQNVLENDGPMKPGTEWERIAKLCDFNSKSNKSGKDVSRMRSIYMQLKQNPIPVQKST